jgi:TPR repeat protein
LGKLYLFGGASLPQNLPTALHWLCRAATQGVDEAWQLIGAHIPFEVAQPARAQALQWFVRAAQEGIPAAVRVLAQLRRIDPAPPAAAGQAHQASTQPAAPQRAASAPSPELPASLPEAWRALEAEQDADQDELLRLRTLAAQGGDRDAQLALGLHLARMNSEGDRVESSNGTVNFKRALRWLAQAGEQGLADAWFAMSRIYIRPEFSQRSASEAHACLERAADMGHSGAQLECGIHAWRARRGAEDNDVRAVYWLQKAAAQGSAEAQQALDRIAPPPPPAGWADPLLPLLTREILSSQPLLAARIELAAMFRLTRAEALLLDVKAADQGHCLVVDIRASYGRSKRRLVLVRTAAERQKLDRIVRLFEQVDADMEGNYRQRLYRLKSWLGADMMAAA